ncbi:hypothetical protein LTS18_002366 [Coniosporium uncinatum]|uniref:Uncharacterized protein n=1 Tax=Coniosporium uncinatum TaxID=93489 RepID=A0ACC3D7U5_9PEZI|nr:hypothetical protein LTS18_002366 [Coniosporium uncinatum]
MGSIAAALPPVSPTTSQEAVPYRPQAQESSQGPAGNEQSGVSYRKVGDTYEIDGDDAPSTLDHGPEDAEDLPDRYYRLKTAIGHLLNAQATQQGRRPAHNEHSVFIENRDRAEMVVDAFGEEKPWDIPLGWYFDGYDCAAVGDEEVGGEGHGVGAIAVGAYDVDDRRYGGGFGSGGWETLEELDGVGVVGCLVGEGDADVFDGGWASRTSL